MAATQFDCRLGVTAVLLWVLSGLGTAAESPKKQALLIGVSKYNHTIYNEPAPLQFPEVDAKELAEVLKHSGYDATVLVGPGATQKAIREKLTALRSSGSAEGVLFVGIFGHGIELGDAKAYYCPYDAEVDFLRDATGEIVPGADGKEIIVPATKSLISLPDDIMRAIKLSPAGNKVLVADACRNDPTQARGFMAKFQTTRRAFGANLTINDLPSNMAVLLACSANEFAFENKEWGHGAFTKILLEEMRAVPEDGLLAGTLSDKLSRRVPMLVRKSTHQLHDQRPHSLVNGSVDLQLVASSASKPTTGPNEPAARIVATPSRPVIETPPPPPDPLSGKWSGRFEYPPGPNSYPPVSFDLSVELKNGTFTGRTTEPNTFGDNTTNYLYGDVSGTFNLATGEIFYTKTYDGTGGVNHSVSYRGLLSANKSVIDGRWTLADGTSGAFRLEKSPR